MKAGRSIFSRVMVDRPAVCGAAPVESARSDRRGGHRRGSVTTRSCFLWALRPVVRFRMERRIAFRPLRPGGSGRKEMIAGQGSEAVDGVT